MQIVGGGGWLGDRVIDADGCCISAGITPPGQRQPGDEADEALRVDAESIGRRPVDGCPKTPAAGPGGGQRVTREVTIEFAEGKEGGLWGGVHKGIATGVRVD